MKKMVTICAIGFVLAATGSVYGALWEINDAGLQDMTNFVNFLAGTDGNLNARSDIPGNPGTRFNITLNDVTPAQAWEDIVIGDSFDKPNDNDGLVAATGNLGDLSGYTGFTMAIHNPGTSAFLAGIYMNTGWTDLGDPDLYYQDGDGSMTWIGAGETKTLVIDFTDAALWSAGWTTGNVVQNLNRVTNIGFKIGANLGNPGEVANGVAFDVDVVAVPLPGAVLLGLLGLSYAGMRFRKSV